MRISRMGVKSKTIPRTTGSFQRRGCFGYCEGPDGPSERPFAARQNRFGWKILMPLETALSEFTLSMYAPDVPVAGENEVRITCHIGKELCGSMTVKDAGPVEFRGTFAAFRATRTGSRIPFIVF
jgi:hypothetical protein